MTAWSQTKEESKNVKLTRMQTWSAPTGAQIGLRKTYKFQYKSNSVKNN